LASATQSNPNYLGNLHSIPTLTLVSSSVSGGKFWQGLPTDAGLDIRWGKNGTRGSLLHKTRHECKDRNPVVELKERFIKKLNKGYAILPQETFLP